MFKYEGKRIDNRETVVGFHCVWQGIHLIFDSPFNLFHNPVEVIPESVRLHNCQDVQVHRCRYCPLNYDGAECMALGGRSIIGEERDKKGIPLFCPLNEKSILIRRTK